MYHSIRFICRMERYVRQMLLEEITPEGQRKLAAAKVLIVGVGGLGSPVAHYLAAAGVGCLGLMDDDAVSLSNLQRQVLYVESEIGQPKAVMAAKRLQALNSQIKPVPIVGRLDESNAVSILSQYDMVVDGCDNFETRYLLDKTCEQLNKPYIYGAIQGFVGQVSVFDSRRGTRRYRDLFPQPSEEASKAVVGMTAAVVGSVQAHEVLKLVCGYGEVLCNRLWTIDLRTMQTHLINL